MSDKPFAPACERNREPILAVLREQFAGCRRVLEIGSGTGQHAVHFAAAMPWLLWQCSDRAEYLPGIRMWLDEAGLANTPPPLELDVMGGAWPARGFDAVFSANTLHIMGWAEVGAFFAGVGRLLGDGGVAGTRSRSRAPSSALWAPSPAGAGEGVSGCVAGVLVVYGPFNHGGAYSSDSNRDFDAWLKARDPASGIRDDAAVDALALRAGLVPVDDVAMPANNRCRTWRCVDQGGPG